MKKIHSFYKNQLYTEALSGGMILPAVPAPISNTAKYMCTEYKNIEDATGTVFGQDYLWHIKHPDQSDWFPNSEKPAIALCIFKEIYPELQISFVTDMQYALYFEGRDLTDNEAYRLILEKYNLSPEDFYEKLYENEYKEKANYEFDLCKQLGVTGYPAVFLQVSDTKFFLLARGYTTYDELQQRLQDRLMQKQ